MNAAFCVDKYFSKQRGEFPKTSSFWSDSIGETDKQTETERQAMICLPVAVVMFRSSEYKEASFSQTRPLPLTLRTLKMMCWMTSRFH